MIYFSIARKKPLGQAEARRSCQPGYIPGKGTLTAWQTFLKSHESAGWVPNILSFDLEKAYDSINSRSVLLNRKRTTRPSLFTEPKKPYSFLKTSAARNK